MASWRDKVATVFEEPRIEAGMVLRRRQRGEKLALPQCRPMAVVGLRCHELRIQDANVIWRIVYRVDLDAVVIADVFTKKTQATPKVVVETCKRRLSHYDEIAKQW